MGSELLELEEAALELAGMWPKLIFILVYFGGTIALIVLGILSLLKRSKRRRNQNTAFGNTAATVTGTEISVKRKYTMVKNGWDIRENREDYTKKYYSQVTYEYFVDGIRYTTTRDFEIYGKDDREHVFYYEPGKPQKIYWTPHDYRPENKRSGCGCLVYIILWVLFNIVILNVVNWLGIMP